MMRRRFLVDVHHLSHRALRDAYELAKANRYYPLFISHGHFRELVTPGLARTELAHPAENVRRIRETGGVFGLRTGPEPSGSYARSGVENNCQGSTRSWAQSYQFGAVGLKVPVAFATDLNGFTTMVGPRYGEGACAVATSERIASERAAQGAPGARGTGTAFDTKGLAHIGLFGGVVRDLKKLDVDTTGLEHSADAFVRMWERAHDAGRERVPTEDFDPSGVTPYQRGQARENLLDRAHRTLCEWAAKGTKLFAKVKGLACKLGCRVRHPLSRGKREACVAKKCGSAGPGTRACE